MAAQINANPQQQMNAPPPHEEGSRMLPTAGIIPGLEPLLPLQQVFIKQKIDVLQAGIGFEQANRYTFFFKNGKILYVANKGIFQIRDLNGNGIILDRSPNCLLTSMNVFAIYTGELLGKIEQKCVCCCFQGARFNVLDEVGNLVFIIKAPYCVSPVCGDVMFDMFTPADMENPVGQITKCGEGTAHERYNNADNFEISFPGDLSVKMKAVLLGASVLIDFMYYESNRNNHNNRHRIMVAA